MIAGDPLVFWTGVYALAAVATAIILAAALKISRGALEQIGEARLTRYADVMDRFARRWQSDDMIEARRVSALFKTAADLKAEVERLHTSNAERYYVLQKVPNFFEDLAVLTIEGAIALDLVRKIYASTIERHWAHWQPSVFFLREARGRPTIYENFEALRNKLAAR